MGLRKVIRLRNSLNFHSSSWTTEKREIRLVSPRTEQNSRRKHIRGFSACSGYRQTLEDWTVLAPKVLTLTFWRPDVLTPRIYGVNVLAPISLKPKCFGDEVLTLSRRYFGTGCFGADTFCCPISWSRMFLRWIFWSRLIFSLMAEWLSLYSK